MGTLTANKKTSLLPAASTSCSDHSRDHRPLLPWLRDGLSCWGEWSLVRDRPIERTPLADCPAGLAPDDIPLNKTIVRTKEDGGGRGPIDREFFLLLLSYTYRLPAPCSKWCCLVAGNGVKSTSNPLSSRAELLCCFHTTSCIACTSTPTNLCIAYASQRHVCNVKRRFMSRGRTDRDI